MLCFDAHGDTRGDPIPQQVNTTLVALVVSLFERTRQMHDARLIVILLTVNNSISIRYLRVWVREISWEVRTKVRRVRTQ
jgi:hypothetical protein